MPLTHLDTSLWPMAVFSLGDWPTDESFETYLGQLSSLNARGQRHTVILDTMHQKKGATAAQRRRQAEWLQQHADVLRRLNIGTAFVIESSFLRGMLTAVLWLQPMPQPHMVAPDKTRAQVWCIERLRLEGISLSPALEELERTLVGL